MTSLEVRRTERLTPGMIRVVAGGDDLVNFPDTPYTDRYVKIVFPKPGVRYPEPFDIGTIRAELPRDQWPDTRTYTVRALDHAAGELTIDFVVHGDRGLAGPWAMRARPGDQLILLGPGGAYLPDPEADWHLLVGDESAIPASAAAAARIPAGTPALALFEVAGPQERQELPGPVDQRWLYRDPARPEQLLDALRATEFPAGRVHAFVHGEAGLVRTVRRHLLAERGVARSALSVSGYWRQGRTEDGWQADKAAERDTDRAAEAAEEAEGRRVATR
jgi:NADPH-dependent ferric siderophore reductase